jgi:hypothetical protein
MLVQSVAPDKVAELERIFAEPPDDAPSTEYVPGNRAPGTGHGTEPIPISKGFDPFPPGTKPLVRPDWLVDDLTAARRENQLVSDLESGQL